MKLILSLNKTVKSSNHIIIIIYKILNKNKKEKRIKTKQTRLNNVC